MITIRNAETRDVSFIANAILEIEKTKNSDTYSNLYGSKKSETENYLKFFLEDSENQHNELSLNSFIIAEEAGKTAGCSALIFTNQDYYLSKSELFPIHLSQEHLHNFIKNAKSLPDHRKVSGNKYFIEYIFVGDDFRGKGIAGKMIDYQIDKINEDEVFINVFEENSSAVSSYKKAGFEEKFRIKIDTDENIVYPAVYKIIMSKKLN